MPDLAEPRDVPHGIHNVVRRFSLRFINHESAVERRRLRLSWHGSSCQSLVISF
jgi:hypothetical protein